METIPKSKCEQIGFIKKLHGVHGEVILEFEYDFEASIEQANRFFIELEGLLVPFFLNENGFRFKSAKTAILNLKWVNTEKKAKVLIEKAVFLYQKEIIPEEKENNKSELEGFILFDNQKGEIGEIIKVDDFSGNIVLSVLYKNDEIMIPFHEDLIISVQTQQKKITIKLPEGLI